MTLQDRLIPQEVLFGSTETTAPAIAPDGRTIAYVAPSGGVANLFVRSVDGGEPRAVTHDTGRGVREFRWAPDGRGLVYQQDAGGDENWRLYVGDIETGERRILVDEDGVRSLILGTSPEQPDVLCVALNIDDPRWHDVYHVRLSDGSRTKVADNPGFSRWAIDAALQPRAGVRPTEEGGAEVLVRDADSDDWRSILSAAPADAFPLLFDVFPMWFSRDGQSLYLVTSKDSDTSALLRVDVLTGAHETVAGHPGGDLLYVWYDPASKDPQVVVVPTDRNQYVVCDPAVQADLDAIRALHPGDAALLSRDDADRLWTLEFTNDEGSRAYYLYDRETRTGEFLFYAQPELEEYDLAGMEPFTYTARDGLEVAGYLFFPPGKTREGLPTVFMIHGGPANRYFWGYQPLAQLLANRGYLVVQVNFRGSIGYGKRFLAAGNRQWGRAMHDDVVDAIKWVTDQGFADRERIGLWGTSYGGYETLYAVTHDPDLVRCAVALVAPVNLITLLESIPPYWRAERAYFIQALGDPETDADELWDYSPLRLADQIKVPLLLFYGERDPRVPVTEAQQLAEALERNAIPHDLNVLPDEGHSIGASMSAEHRTEYLTKLEAFYATHLGGRVQGGFS